MADELTEYTLICLENAVAMGAETNAEMAESLGVTTSTFEKIKYGQRKDGESEKARIGDAIKRGKERRMDVFLAMAENSLKKLVNGYTYDEITVETEADGDGVITKTKKKTVTKYVQPNTTAVLFSAVNSGGGRWKSINSKEGTDTTVPEIFKVEIK
jgi:hypothetical protein